MMTACAGHLPDVDNRPNIVLIVADDLGYSDLGCFGSEINTPNIDALARAGRIFTNFYTAATCSPTRAMLLTGVDHHLAGLGDMAERIPSIPVKMGQPGYEGYLNRSVISIAQLIKDAGYQTYMAGKWHLGLLPDQSPAAKGFDQSFSLLGGYADHFYPDPRYCSFWETDHYGKYPGGNYSTDFYTDKLLGFVESDKRSNRPFFMYAAYTAPHWPLQVPAEYIEKYHSVYDIGYDSLRVLRFNGLQKLGLIGDNVELPELPEVEGNLYDISDRPLVRWDSLDPFEKQIESRKMEIYAGMIDNLDVNIGRLIQGLKDLGEYDNTLFIFLSDNGPAVFDVNEVADQNNPLTDMGTTHSFVAYGPPWAHACSAVNRLYKGYSSEGGIHSPMIIRMPYQTEGAGISTAFATVCDLVPTLLDLVEKPYPEEYEGHELHRLEGKSMLPLLTGINGQIHEEDFVMGWELFGRCALRKGKWKITKMESPFGTNAFELFDMETDPSESHDLSGIYPDKYQELLTHWSNYVLEKGVILVNR